MNADMDPRLRPVMRFDRPSEWPRIRGLLEASFGRSEEADMVERLRADGDFLFMIVAEIEDGFIGAVGFSRLPIVGERMVDAAALAPIAVAEDFRGVGVGAALVRAGLAQCRRRGAPLVCVAGARRFFAQTGFAIRPAAQIDAPWSPGHLQALALDDALGPIEGVARYPKGFFTDGAAPEE